MNNRPFFHILFFSLLLSGALFLPRYSSGQSLASAPIQGHTTANSIKLWLMAKDAGQLRLVMRDGMKSMGAKTVDVSGVKFWKGYAPITVEFLRLEPGKAYTLHIEVDGEPVEEVYEFSTFEAEGLADYEFLLGSCHLYATGIWKMAWPEKRKIFKSMAKQDTDFMLWLGDNVYLLFGEWEEAERFQKKFTKVRLDKQVNAFMRTRPNYAIWDDHDFGPDNSDSSFENKEATLANFQSFWPNPYFATDETEGIFSHFRYQDSEFFLLDDRYHRIAEGQQQMLGAAQMAWLKERLSASQATFKFIASGSQVLNQANRYECFAMFPEQQELLDFILEEKIEGVVFLSGDRHFTEVLMQRPENGYPLYEFTCSPMTSFLKRKAKKKDHPEQLNPQVVPGTLLVERNYGQVAISGPAEDRVCTLSVYDKKGKQQWEYQIRAEDLRF